MMMMMTAHKNDAGKSETVTRAVTLRSNAGSTWSSHFLLAGFDHRPLQRAVHLLYAAGAAGVVAAQRNSDLRRDAASHPHRGGAGCIEGQNHRWRAAYPARCARSCPRASENPRA